MQTRLNDVRQAVEDAVWAPSVHNTQPWRFGLGGSRVSVRADVDRRLETADPGGREMLISCGAALYNLRLSLRTLGYEPVVRRFPDPERPQLLADVYLEPGGRPDEDSVRLQAQIRRRRSHRGGFTPDPVPGEVLTAVRRAAETEGARLVQAVDAHVKGALAALTDAAEHVQRRMPAYTAEIARWAPAPGTRRADGVQQMAYPRQTPRTEPNFAARDFARGHGWGTETAPARTPDEVVPDEVTPTSLTGTVFLLVTAGDTRAEWLRAGEAMQRVLLRATQSDVSAAFHTQALQVPELRAFVRTHFCGEAHPQLLLRLGTAMGGDLSSVRRPVDEVIVPES